MSPGKGNTVTLTDHVDKGSLSGESKGMGLPSHGALLGDPSVGPSGIAGMGSGSLGSLIQKQNAGVGGQTGLASLVQGHKQNIGVGEQTDLASLAQGHMTTTDSRVKQIASIAQAHSATAKSSVKSLSLTSLTQAHGVPANIGLASLAQTHAANASVKQQTSLASLAQAHSVSANSGIKQQTNLASLAQGHNSAASLKQQTSLASLAQAYSATTNSGIRPQTSLSSLAYTSNAATKLGAGLQTSLASLTQAHNATANSSSGQQTSLASLTQGHDATANSSSRQQTSLASLAQAHGTSTNLCVGPSLGSLAQAHKSAANSVTRPQTSLAGLAQARKPVANVEESISKLCLKNPPSQVPLLSQLNPMSSPTVVDIKHVGKATSLTDLASKHLSHHKDTQPGVIISQEPLSLPTSSKAKTHDVGQDGASASNFGACANISVNEEVGRGQHRPGGVPSLLTLSQLKLVSGGEDSTRGYNGHQQSPSLQQPAKRNIRRPPPGFKQEVSAKKMSSVPPGFTSHTSNHDDEDKSMMAMSKKSQYGNINSEQFTISRKRRHVQQLCQPSIFGKIVCCEYIPPNSPHIPTKSQLYTTKDVKVSQIVLYRTFSYERQKSLGSPGDGPIEEDIVPFDFSTPSPDDIVRNRQSGAFIRGSHH